MGADGTSRSGGVSRRFPGAGAPPAAPGDADCRPVSPRAVRSCGLPPSAQLLGRMLQGKGADIAAGELSMCVRILVEGVGPTER